jgi:hypothetical protein
LEGRQHVSNCHARRVAVRTLYVRPSA